MLSAIRVTGVSILMLSLVVSFVFAQGEPLRPALLVPHELTWAPGPAGALLATVVGDSTKPGTYVVRAKFPAGFRVPPHFHPDDRIVTVLSGTVYVGYGEQFDESKMKALPAGSVWTEPANQPHFAWAKDGEAVIQTLGYGPSGTTPIKPRQ
jgi:quercetin dioxygenase-like cupin family protein